MQAEDAVLAALPHFAGGNGTLGDMNQRSRKINRRAAKLLAFRRVYALMPSRQ
jgi:hypothetical protein